MREISTRVKFDLNDPELVNQELIDARELMIKEQMACYDKIIIHCTHEACEFIYQEKFDKELITNLDIKSDFFKEKLDGKITILHEPEGYYNRNILWDNTSVYFIRIEQPQFPDWGFKCSAIPHKNNLEKLRDQYASTSSK